MGRLVVIPMSQQGSWVPKAMLLQNISEQVYSLCSLSMYICVYKKCELCFSYMHLTPFLLMQGHLTAKNDVYSFGVVLLEMLSGRRAIDRNKPSEEQMLAPHAKRTINMRKFSQVLHPSILGQYPKSSVLKVAQLASQCVSDEPNFRPNMKDVVEVLEELQKSNDNERCKSSKLRKSSIASKYGRKTLR